MFDLRLQTRHRAQSTDIPFSHRGEAVLLHNEAWDNVQPLLPLFVSRSANIVCAKSFVALNPGASTPNGLVFLHQRKSGFRKQIEGGCHPTHWLTLKPNRNATTGLAAA